MNLSFLVVGYLALWGLGLFAAFVFLFVVLGQRLKERKSEKAKHKDYDNY
ncbi:hypothetical protein [Cellulosilyticum sp. I15G10I2]|nr:hypothetical protein [Cellulosilyticum sp. I15G10I2]